MQCLHSCDSRNSAPVWICGNKKENNEERKKFEKPSGAVGVGAREVLVSDRRLFELHAPCLRSLRSCFLADGE